MQQIKYLVVLAGDGNRVLVAHKIQKTLEAYDMVVTNFFSGSELVPGPVVVIVPETMANDFSVDKKILAIPRLKSDQDFDMNIFSDSFEKVFSTEKEQKDKWLQAIDTEILFFSGIEKKLPKKLAKHVCEYVLGKKVVMVHEKLRNFVA